MSQLECPECGCGFFAGDSVQHGFRLTGDYVMVCLSCKRWWAIEDPITEESKPLPLTDYLVARGYNPGERYAR